jgi:hypothetical protein
MRKQWIWPWVKPELPGIWYMKPYQIFEKEWLDYMEELGLPILCAMLFYKPAFYDNDTAHIDTYAKEPTRPNIFGLNWTVGGEGSSMVWYHPSEIKPVPKINKAGTPFYEWPVAQLVEMDRCNIQDQITMVRVDVPHSIAMGSTSRWGISARISNEPRDWDSSVFMLRERNLLLD